MNFKNHKYYIKGISLQWFGAIPGKDGFSLSPDFLPLPLKGPCLVRALLPSVSEAKEISSVMMTCMAVGPLCSQGLLGGGGVEVRNKRLWEEFHSGQKAVWMVQTGFHYAIISPWDTSEVQVAPAFFPNANSFCSLLFLPDSTWPCCSGSQHCRD